MERIIRSEHIYEIRNVSRKFSVGGETVNALDNISLDIKLGEFVVIIGPSGSGKTTLLSAMGLVDTPDKGRVYINGERVDDLGESQKDAFRKENIGFIFQSFNLIPELNARGNVMLPLLLLGFSWRQAKKKAEEMLTLMGIQSKYKSYPFELSGGQQQRVAVARALAKDSLVILADEPTANLDSQNAAQLIDFLHKLSKERKTTMVIVTHDLEIAKKADRVLTIRDGKLTEADEHALRLQPYAERTTEYRQKIFFQEQRMVDLEETRSRNFVRVSIVILLIMTLVGGAVLNSLYEFIPPLVIPQIKNVLTNALKNLQSLAKSNRIINPEEEIEIEESQERIKQLTPKESQIITIYADLLNKEPSSEEIDDWQKKDYEKTALRFEFIKSKTYGDYLKGIAEDKGLSEAIKTLGKAIFEEDLPQEALDKVKILPPELARRALIQTELYRKYLASKAPTIRGAEIEFLFESILDKAPEAEELQKFSEGSLFMDEIKREITTRRNNP